MNDDRQSNHLIREFKRLDGGSNYISASSLNLICVFRLYNHCYSFVFDVSITEICHAC